MPLQLDDLAALDAPTLENSGQPLMLPVESIDEDPEQPRRDHGVEDRGEREAEVALQRRHVVVGAVEGLAQAGVGHGRGEGGEVAEDEGVHEAGLAPVGRDLEEADLLEVVVQAVRLAVEADGAAALQGAGELRQVVRGADPRGRHGREYTLGGREALPAGACNVSGHLGSNGVRPGGAVPPGRDSRRSGTVNKDVVVLTDDNWKKEVTEAEGPVLVDFWAEWCPPCRMIAPSIDALATAYSGRAKVGKLNVDENPAVAQAFGVRSIPTLLVFKDGKVADQQIGALPQPRIAEMLDRQLDTAGTRQA